MITFQEISDYMTCHNECSDVLEQYCVVTSVVILHSLLLHIWASGSEPT